MGTKERRQREKAKREQDILEAAQQVFFEKGYHQTKMDDIAKVAELSKGSLYLHFKSKDELFTRLLTECHFAILDKLRKLPTVGMNGLAQLIEVGLIYFSFFKEYPGHARAVATIMVFPIPEESYGVYSQAMMEACDEENQIVMDIVKKGQEDGSISTDLIPELVSSQMWLALMGVHLGNEQDTASYLEEYVPEHTDTSGFVQLLLKSLLRGFSASFEQFEELYQKRVSS